MHRRLWGKLFNNFTRAAQAVVQRGGHLVIEWPSNCLYWREPRVRALLDISELKWNSIRVRACAFGQRIEAGANAGKALTKVWRLETTMPRLHEVLQLPCPGGHEHVTTAGQHTTASGKHPKAMADAFHKQFAKTARTDVSSTSQSDLVGAVRKAMRFPGGVSEHKFGGDNEHPG